MKNPHENLSKGYAHENDRHEVHERVQRSGLNRLPRCVRPFDRLRAMSRVEWLLAMTPFLYRSLYFDYPASSLLSSMKNKRIVERATTSEAR